MVFGPASMPGTEWHPVAGTFVSQQLGELALSAARDVGDALEGPCRFSVLGYRVSGWQKTRTDELVDLAVNLANWFSLVDFRWLCRSSSNV